MNQPCAQQLEPFRRNRCHHERTSQAATDLQSTLLANLRLKADNVGTGIKIFLRSKPKGRALKTARGLIVCSLFVAPLLSIDAQSQSLIRGFGRPLLPIGSAIVAKSPRQIILDPNRKYDMPVTLFSILPMYDNTGQVAVPTGSVIKGLLQKREGGDYLSVTSLVYRGLEIPVEASGQIIPAQIRPESYNQFTVPPKTKSSGFFEAVVNSNLVSGLTSVLLINNTSERGGQFKLGTAMLGLLAADALFRGIAVLAERQIKPLPPLVEIPDGAVIVVSLSKDLSLPETSSPDTVPVLIPAFQQ